MDPERAQGSVLTCTPTPLLSPLYFCATSTATTTNPDGNVGVIPKPKKKRSRPRTKNTSRNVNDSLVNVPQESQFVTIPKLKENIFEKSIKEVHDTIDLMDNLQIATLENTPKPRRVRKRKKSSKEKKGEQVGEKAASSSDSQGDAYVEGKNDRIKDKIVKKKEILPRDLPVGSPKHLEPFFPDNRKQAGKKKSGAKKKSVKEEFDDYLSAAEVELGLKNKTMIAGAIRINSRCYKEAYISSEGDEKDIMIEGLKNRNRALEGDDVVILINPPAEWKTISGQRTGKVVYIQDQVHSRTCIGKLPSVVEPNNTYIVFSPRDSRIPRIKIHVSDVSLPPEYHKNPSLYADTLFHAQISSWKEVSFADGIILGAVGKSGDVEVETLAILLENNLDPKPISSMLNMFFPRLPYTIPLEEIENRLDLRKECIFTIDPATAKDLDDAVSARRLDNGNIEVGVHISDVSHFLHESTLLDKAVAKRATTVYLVQRVYHMLPVELCQLCSLTAGEDKLAFSVFLELTPEAHVVSHRFARSVIHSCVKLAYEHAQMVIDNPEKEFTAEDFPEVSNGFTAENCAATIRELFKLSLIMRKRRFDSGALRIDQPKLCFHLDVDMQTPLSSFIYINKESHRLIEEFMLLANMTVAEHIYTVYPKLAFLRQHRPPRLNMMTELQKRLAQYGIHLDITDAGTLHSSMLKYGTPLADEAEDACWARYSILNNLCAKPMLRAAYFCPSDENCDLHHYALNVSCYTHFTSPIRRYADVMVHRLLAASLDLTPQLTWSPSSTHKIAQVCNRQKLAAKVAGEQSSQLFLALYLSEPVESAAAVLDVKDRSLDVIVKDFGIVTRVYTDPLPAKVEYCNDDNMAQLYIQWQGRGPVQLIQLFSVVRVQLSRAKDGLKLSASLLPPLP